MPSFPSTQYTITIHDGLTGSRAAVIDDTGPTIPEVPLDLFFDHVLPCPPVVSKASEIFDALTEGDDPAYTAGRWTSFPDDPSKTKEYETVVFRRLERIADAVIKQAQLVSPEETQTLFRNDPDLVPESRWRETTSRPDSFFVLRKRRSAAVAHWADIVATGEFKRKDGSLRNLEDDSKKVLWNMHQTLRDDPRRRFTFGFTIENRCMRIWFCSRAEILVSAPFDFISQSVALVRFFLALTFASECELGWDPTMKFVSGLKPYYIITVRSPQGEKMRFKTEELLSGSGAEAIRGRATRVWKVRRWIGERTVGPYMVLKDCWVDSDRLCEGEVMEKILKSASSQPEHDKVLRRGLLTTVIHGDVHITDDVVDCTLRDRRSLLEHDGWFLVHRSDELMKVFDNFSKLVASGSDKEVPGAPRGLHDHLNNSVLKPIIYHPKRHYRIVFEEVCTPFDSETSLSVVFHILSDTCTILKSLHAIGWVHRDISCGNILVDQTTKVVKLADVEYAKKTGRRSGAQEVGHHDIRTGTVDFMSVEVADMLFKYQPRTSTELQWFYHPLNDLESVWWLMAWSTLNRDVYFVQRSSETHVPIPPSTGAVTRSRRRKLDDMLQRPQPPSCGQAPDADDDQLVPPGLPQETRVQRFQRIKSQHAFAYTLFIERNGLARSNIMLLAHIFQRTLRRDKPLHPALSVLAKYLIEARDLLVDAYVGAEMDLSQLPGKMAHFVCPLHDQFKTIFDRAEGDIARLGVGVHVRRLSTEHRKILAAEDKAKAERDAVMAMRNARFGLPAPKPNHGALPATKPDAGPRQPPKPSSRQRPEKTPSCADLDGPLRKRFRKLPAVPEVPEPEPGGDGERAASAERPSTRALPTVPEEEASNEEQPVAGPSKKRKRVATAEDLPTRASRATRRSTRAKHSGPPTAAAGPPAKSSTKPGRNKPSRAAAMPQDVPAAPKKKRAAPPTRPPAPAPDRRLRARAAKDTTIPATASEGEERTRASRPSKKPRVVAVGEFPKPNAGGRVLRSRKK